MERHRPVSRLFAVFLTAIMVMGIMPTVAFAENTWGGTGVAEVQKDPDSNTGLCAMGNNLMLRDGSDGSLTQVYYADASGGIGENPIDLSTMDLEITGNTESGFDLKDICLWGTYTGSYNSDASAFADLDAVIWMQGGTLSEIMSDNGSTAVCRSITVYMSGGTLTGENSTYNSAITANATYVSGGRIEKNLTAQFPRYLSGSPSIGGEGCGITVKTGEKFYLNGALNGADVYVVPQGDFADGTVIAEASGSYTIAENDIAQLHLTGDYAQGKELYLEDNQVKIRAAQAVVEQDTYEIGTAEQLIQFAELVNSGNNGANAVLTADIDMSGKSWTGIFSNASYIGVFDGQGHTISNLTGTEGLFVKNAGTVKNVRLQNVSITREGGNLGAVAGENTGTVFNCVSSGNITGTGDQAWSIGGLVGHNNGGTLSGSASSCAVSGSTAGGLVGSNYNSAENYGKITACIYMGTAESDLEGDTHYGDSINVYYKDSNGQWKSYPGNSETNENAVLQSVNGYIAENGGTFILSGDGATYPTGAVSYLDYTENGFVTKYVVTYTEINSNNLPTEWNTGWYVVDGNVTIGSGVTVSGDVKLVLKDGASLTVNGGIKVPSGSTFTVYGQQNGTGSLTSTGTSGAAGIGGTADNVNFGTIILSAKGEINAIGAERAAGIGGGGQMNNNQSVDGTIHIYCGTVEATGGRWAAGIGGGADSVTNCTIIIDGGTITARGGENNVGIGGTEGSKTITINGGTITATGSGAGAGIGGSYDASGGTITITGGVVEAGSIGGGSAAGGGPGGTIVISGGVVTADRIGAGGSNTQGSFSTGGSGDAAIFAGSITDQSGKENWSGLIFEDGQGKIYGTDYTVDQNLTIPQGNTLVVESGKTLVVNEGVVLINNGTIQVNKGGTYSGNQPSYGNVSYQIDWDTDDDGDVDDTTYVAYGEIPAHDDGSKEPTISTVYTFTSWTPEIAAVTGTVTYTAQFSSDTRTYTVIVPTGNGYTIQYSGKTEVAYDSNFTFTVKMAQGYYQAADFMVKANGTPLAAGADGSYTVKVTGATEITIEGVAEDLTAPVISGVTNGETYYTTQAVTVSDTNLESITLNGETVNGTFTIEGNREKTYTIVAIDKAGNKTEYTLTMKPISSLEESIGGLSPDNVTSQDKGTVEAVKEQIESIDLEDATEDEKVALQEILNKCDELVKIIEESVQAGNTENTDKVSDITADNVKPEDKDDLMAAKEDLENALENFGDNYTEEEKAEIQNKLDQINNALESIEKAETVRDAISKLPDTVEPDETDKETLIKDAQKQYEALTEHEKSLISEALKKKLENLLADLVDYRIIAGDNGRWTQGGDGSLGFTANGAYSKFTGIQVDGKDVDTSQYTARSGSTIITLKPAYLDTLSAGKHTLTVLYTDGQTSGSFEIEKAAIVDTSEPEDSGNATAAQPNKELGTSVPQTGDNSNIVLWLGLFIVASASLVGLWGYTRMKKH